jgi:hypothetical protein
MKKFFAILNLSIFCLFCTASELTILNRQGGALTGAQRRDVTIEIKKTESPNNVETIEYRLESLADGEQFFQLRCSAELTGENISVFDGLELVPANASEHHKQQLFLGTFPLAAAWTATEGIAVAAGAEDHHSFLYMDLRRGGGKAVITQTVNAALLKKGSIYEGKFHVIQFSPKYGERDAMSRYYKLYPQRFLPNPEVDPRLYGISATYSSWIRSNPEWARFTGAEWEWCLHAGRHWGDLTGDYYDMPHEKYIERYYFTQRDGKFDPKNLNGMPQDEFREIQKQRLADGYYCGIANGYYTTGASRINKAMSAKFNDSLAAAHPQVLDHYDYADSVFAFPETSWFKELMRMIRVVADRDDVGAIAFDIPLESEVYRGPKLREMTNAGFDKFGAGVVRAVANSKLYQAINQVPAKFGNYKLGVIKNGNSLHQINDCFYADNCMAEANPWQYAPPWPRFVRYAMGEKGATFWEGYHPEEFDANYNSWPQEDRDQLIRDLGHYAAHRAFLYGVTCGAHFTSEYLTNLAPAMQACIDARYKVVPGLETADGDITVTRYGNADRSFIALCNKSKTVKTPTVEVFAGEFSSDIADAPAGNALIFAGFLGGDISNLYRNGKEFVSAPVQPLRVNILEAVGAAPAGATGEITAKWDSRFAQMTLTLVSKNYSGAVQLREQFGSYKAEHGGSVKLSPGQPVSVIYRNSLSFIDDDAIKAMPLIDGSPRFTIRYADDHWSREMAERTAVFFRELGKYRVPLEKDSALPEFTVALSLNGKVPALTAPGIGGNAENLVVHAASREELSTMTRLMLDVLNNIKYPEYIWGVKMDDTDRSIFQTRRYSCSYR